MESLRTSGLENMIPLIHIIRKQHGAKKGIELGHFMILMIDRLVVDFIFLVIKIFNQFFTFIYRNEKDTHTI